MPFEHHHLTPTYPPKSTRPMETIGFVSTLRQQALLLGDYNAYRQMCSRRLAKLRKRLGRVNDPRKKDQRPAPVRAEDIAKDPTYTHIFIYQSERAWAHAMHMKSLGADGTESSSRAVRDHIRSRLAKAASHARALQELCSDPASQASGVDIVEVTAYASSLAGTLVFEKRHWDEALRELAVSRACYDALLGTGAGGSDKKSFADVYKEFLTGTVDPSIRYAAYQLGIPRTTDIAVLVKQFFPHEAGNEDLVKRLNELYPSVLSDGGESEAVEGVEQTVVVNSVNWRGRVAPVEVGDIAVALGAAQKTEQELRKAMEGKKAGSKRSADDFDGVLLAWQECVDETKKAIDKARGEGVGGADPRLQKLQLIYTYVNYGLIGWRIGRNRVMAEDIEASLKEEGIGGQGRELVALYDAILQSLDQITELPGVAADEDFCGELEAKRAFFAALRCTAIAPSHLKTNLRNSLALYHRALTYVTSALRTLPSNTPSPDTHQTLTITSHDAASLKNHLEALVTKYIALIQLQDYMSKSAKAAPATHAPIIDTLDVYNEKVDFQNLVPIGDSKGWNIEPVPVKPIFFDIAWNFVSYPNPEGAEGKKQAKAQGQGQGQEASSKKGFLGGFFGR